MDDIQNQFVVIIIIIITSAVFNSIKRKKNYATVHGI